MGRMGTSVSRVVPVVEVAAETSQACRWSRDCAGQIHEFGHGEKAKLAAAWRALSSRPTLVGETRGASKRSFFLDIVGDEIVVALRRRTGRSIARCAAPCAQERMLVRCELIELGLLARRIC